MNELEFIEEIKKLGINIDDYKLQKLNKFYNLLIEWNNKINLTRITNKDEVYLKHFYDSLTLIKAIDLNKDLNLLDIGTGAGFPGIVLKIVFPNLKVTLLDSLNKRINYLNEIIKELELKDIDTICMRAEDYTKENREKYDVVVSRAVSELSILTEISFSTVKVDGVMIAMKTDNEDEIKKASDIIKKMNGKLIKTIDFMLPFENSKRKLVVIKKIEKTDKKYPRNYSIIKKNK